MISFMHDLGPALWAETLKLKRTLALSLAFIAPVLIYWDRGSTQGPVGRDTWISLAQNNLLFWNLLMVPLFTTLQTALLAGLEHAHKNWKHIFALPVSRGAIYVAKQVVATGLIGLSSLVLWAGIIVSGLVLRRVQPGIGLEHAIPLWRILQYTLLAYFTSWLIIALHTWIGMRWPSFVVAMGVGIGATVVAVIVVQSDYPLYYPWTLPATLTLQAIKDGTFSYGWATLGTLGGFAACILGGLEFTRRDVL
jgi:hypothetical protein